MIGSDECPAKGDVTELDKSVTLLVSTTSRMEVSITTLSDAMEILARSQVIVEQHTKDISDLSNKVSKLEDNASILQNNMHTSCSLKDKEINQMDKDLTDKIEDSAKEADSRGVTRALIVMALTATIFGYIYYDMDSTENKAIGRDTVIFSKLDKLIDGQASLQKNVALNTLTSQHNKEMLEEEKSHNHRND